MRSAVTLTGAFLLLVFLACGGSASPGPRPIATALAYANPTDTSQWRLVSDSSSTSTHLVLDLLAPAGSSGMGVTLMLSVDGSMASWGQASGTLLVKPGPYAGPLASRASVASSDLRILLSQENPTQPLAYPSAPVLSVALDLKPGTQAGSVSLGAAQAGHLAAPLTVPTAIVIHTGALTAQ